MLNSKNITQNHLINDQIINEVQLDENQRLVTPPPISTKTLQLIRNQQNLKYNSIDKAGQTKKNSLSQLMTYNWLNLHNIIILTLLIMLTLLLSLILFQKDFLQFVIFRSNESKVHIDESIQSATLQEKTLQPCLSQKQAFSTYYNSSDKQMKNINNFLMKDQLNQCTKVVLGYYDLEGLVLRWNQKYSTDIINHETLRNDSQKQQLLVFLNLYFNGGIYINVTIPYCKISNRVLKYTLTGFQPIFNDYSQKNKLGIYVPDARKFMKIRFPYAPTIRNMITKLVKKEDYLSECRTKQCLIVR